ncbi:MAG: hypothetical protein PWP08_1788 [Methanofollis sp.]|nr:hypothetical protein [Methanofollis sp.]
MAATLLEHALRGAASVGARTELVQLYDLEYRGCTSCFACKIKGGKSYGKCAVRDGLTPVLKKSRGMPMPSSSAHRSTSARSPG